MFDPDGDQAAADSTRPSISLGTGSSLNPRTARRLLTASYTSMIASQASSRFVQTHAVQPRKRSVLPGAWHPTKGVAINRHMAHRRERQVYTRQSKVGGQCADSK